MSKQVREKTGNEGEPDESPLPENLRFRYEIGLDMESSDRLEAKAKLFGFKKPNAYIKAMVLWDLGLWNKVLDRRKLSRKETC